MSNLPVYRTIREQVANQIRAEVLSGELAEGENLREQTLAKRYGVSRGPVRDALLQLTQEGLLEAKPNCGVKVGAAASEDIQPLVIELRRLIEVFALRKLFVRLTEQDVHHLDELTEQLRVACEMEDVGQIAQLDMDLHRYLIEASGDSELLAIWLPIVSRMMLHYARHGDMMESHQEHVSIVKAIRNRDMKRAIKALTENIQ